jgi:hypothetical protein
MAATKPFKTQANDSPVAAYLSSITDADRRADCEALDALMAKPAGTAGTMFDATIVGYGSSVITYSDGRTMPWFAIGFSSRQAEIALYGLNAFARDQNDAPKPLGKFKVGKGCVYVKRLADIDTSALQALLRSAIT